MAPVVVVEAVASVDHDGLGLACVGEGVSGQDFPFGAAEEGFSGGVVEAGADPAHGLADALLGAQLRERVCCVG